ncbi:hypothetical protein K9O30_01860 [Clostridium bowmanii]|uniref:hypothetical protein n=1 Tax=Clostridium bowmanii TaxID=132925 RepID=UPI001C0C31C3|nr:hypothetical protein [Clostridium bowmanii]MBU3190284.1 hypothetical protein [Clostridium bowmanii]MCA1072504.1 hypothetical protein [Clostridium bowmanii]
MYLSIFKKKTINVKLFAIFLLFSSLFLVTTVYAAVPYTYTPKTITTNTGTTTTAINTINVSFDYDMTAFGAGKITVYQTETIGSTIEKTPSTVLRDLKISAITPSTPTGKVLSIEIGELDPSVTNYAIKIEKDALKFSGNYIPLTDFVLPFSSTDLSNGFQSIFMNNSADNLNANIFEYNSPRDISIIVPKKCITSIETIHKKDGLIIPPTDDTPITTTYPRLTNIDVKTDAAVKRLKVSVTSSTGLVLDKKELFPSASFGGFTTGQAGLDIDTGLEYTISIIAFDINGKFLEDFSKTEKLVDVKGEIVSNYVSKTSTSSNKTITLYDLMKTPATLISMLTAYTTNLDSIKVVYPNTNDTRVISNSLSQDDAVNLLANALSDVNVQYIRFSSAFTIKPSQDVELVRPSSTIGKIVLDGNGSTITGNVIVGDGDANIYELRNITINGDLTVNVTGVGDCILTNVTVTGTKTINKNKACVVTDVVAIDDTSLYKIGEIMKIGIKFSEPVFVVGSPVLKLNTTTSTSTSSIGKATYDATLSTKDEIVFGYTVKEDDDFSNIITSGIDLVNNTAAIQATQGAVSTDAIITGAASKIISSSVSKKDIVGDGIRPSMHSISVDSSKITYISSEPIDRTSFGTGANWIIRSRNVDGTIFSDYTPKSVVLQGDNRTVIIEMTAGVTFATANITTATISNGMASIFMPIAVKDKAGNASNDMVILAADSFGVAWHNGIVGLTPNMKYKVIIGTGITTRTEYLQANSDSVITELKNGETYKVEDITVGATAEIAKVSDAIVKTVPSGTTNDKTNIESAMLALANAAVDSVNYTVTIDNGSTYDIATNAWSGKFVVTSKTISANTKTDASTRSITVVIP